MSGLLAEWLSGGHAALYSRSIVIEQAKTLQMGEEVEKRRGAEIPFRCQSPARRTVPDSKSRQKTLMVYFRLKSIINTTLNFTKSESWPTLKLGFIPQKVCQSTPFTLVNSMLVSKSVEAI